MKSLKNIIKWAIISLSALIIGLYLFGYGYLITAVRTIYFNGHTTAFLEDYTEFDNRTIEAGTHQPWPEHKNYNKIAPTVKLNEIHKKYESVAFLVIRKDSVWHEQYFDGYDNRSRSNSFSMAKSIVSALMGKAIMEGHIKSLDQPVSDFFPEFSEGAAAKLTVGDLSSMGSSMNWDESYYSPFSVTTQAYFDSNLRDVILEQEITDNPGPGKSYEYLSGNTQLLGMIVEKATGQKLSDYLSEKFWKPLGANDDATWQLDSEEFGLEKAYCCIASNVRNFARFGKLYKDLGKWNGEQILDANFVEKSIRPRFEDGENYGYGFWLSNYMNKEIFYMRGHLGQYTIVIPEDNLIIVRLGRIAPETTIEPFLDEVYEMLAHETKN